MSNYFGRFHRPLRRAPRPSLIILSMVVTLSLLLLTGMVFAGTGAFASDPEPRIVGGQEADPGEWPWQVALITPGAPPFAGQFCGGSMIDPGWVLTAAHCVDHEDESRVAVVAGIFDLRFPEPGAEGRNVAEIIVHPGWDPSTNDNDIALLRLSSPIPFRGASGNILPITGIRLPSPSVGSLVGENATVTGWGNTIAQPIPGGNSFPDRLMEVSVPIISNSVCNQSYGSITDNMLCAGLDQGGKDSCQGDSGGPMVYFNDAAGRWEQAGVVSFGIGCAAPDFPGVYARVSRYIGWIDQATKPPINVNSRAYLPSQMHLPIGAPPTPPPTPSPTPLPPGSLLPNGNFEQGPVVWSETSTGGFTIIRNDFSPTNVVAHSGSWAAWLGGADNEQSLITQQVMVPSNQPILTYYHLIGSQDACGFDFGGVIINGFDFIDSLDLCTETSTPGWVQRAINLSAYAGQTIDITIWAQTDGSLNSNLFIDDVAFQAVPTTSGNTPSGEAPRDAALSRSGD